MKHYLKNKGVLCDESYAGESFMEVTQEIDRFAARMAEEEHPEE